MFYHMSEGTSKRWGGSTVLFRWGHWNHGVFIRREKERRVEEM